MSRVVNKIRQPPAQTHKKNKKTCKCHYSRSVNHTNHRSFMWGVWSERLTFMDEMSRINMFSAVCPLALLLVLNS